MSIESDRFDPTIHWNGAHPAVGFETEEMNKNRYIQLILQRSGADASHAFLINSGLMWQCEISIFFPSGSGSGLAFNRFDWSRNKKEFQAGKVVEAIAMQNSDEWIHLPSLLLPPPASPSAFRLPPSALHLPARSLISTIELRVTTRALSTWRGFNFNGSHSPFFSFYFKFVISFLFLSLSLLVSIFPSIQLSIYLSISLWIRFGVLF